MYLQYPISRYLDEFIMDSRNRMRGCIDIKNKKQRKGHTSISVFTEEILSSNSSDNDLAKYQMT